MAKEETKTICEEETLFGTPTGNVYCNVSLQEQSFNFGQNDPTKVGFVHNLTLNMRASNSSEISSYTILGIDSPEQLKELGECLLRLGEQLKHRQEILERTKENLKSLG